MEAAVVVTSTLDSRRRLATWAGLAAGLLVGVLVDFVLPSRFPPAQTGTLATLALLLALLLGYMVWAGTLVMSSWAKVWRRAIPEGTTLFTTLLGWWNREPAFLAACLVGALGGWVSARRTLVEVADEYRARGRQAATELARLQGRAQGESIWDTDASPGVPL
jgi:hypothetical protein